MINPVGKNGQLRCAIYTRVSTKDQNCDRQIADLTSYAYRCNYDVVGIYKETASGAKLDRQVRKRVMVAARDRRIDIILVSELTRWGRSTTDLIVSIQQLQSWQVSVVAQNGFQLNMSTRYGKAKASILATFAEFERDLLTERILLGLAAAATQGKTGGRPTGGKIMDSCDRINELREQGMSGRAIAREVGLSKSSIAKCPRCEKLSEGMDW